MQVIFNNANSHRLNEPVAVALGTFDGLHKGHQALIHCLNEIKYRYKCSAMVYTFERHPLNFLLPDNPPPQIMNLNKKILEFHRLGVDLLVLNNFDENFARTTPRDFVDKLLLYKYDIRYVVVGYNYRFGYKAEGDVQLLQKIGSERGFSVIVLPPYKVNGEVVSSSLIRTLIQKGQVFKAARLLGRYYSISGKVVSGAGRGKKLGYPTANLDIGSKNVVIPRFGVYLTKWETGGKRLWGVTNVGTNPTFNEKGIHIETHFWDFHGELYGHRMRIDFVKYIRDEIRFASVHELTDQLERDVHTAKNLVYNVCKV
ncbi:MAG: bifunctional riboflavin kinase/FAD synthetase [Clostridiales bacterium]|nr:bifunctional riboflavin kinase/FAD synthetase [Clostridiales bacterium]